MGGVGVAGGQLGQGHLLAAGEQEREPAVDRQRAQRRHDRRDPEDVTRNAVDHAQHEAEADAEGHRRRRTSSMLGEELGDDERDQPDDRLDRQVDVAGDDDDRLADGRDGDDRGEHA